MLVATGIAFRRAGPPVPTYNSASYGSLEFAAKGKTMNGSRTGRNPQRIAARLALTLGMAASLGAAFPVTVPGNFDLAATQTNGVALVNSILDRWEPLAVESGVHSSAWREALATQLKLMDTSILEGIDAVRPNARDARASYALFAQAVRNAEMQSYMLAQSGKGHIKLGSASTDQVFIPIVPCRIVDTRNVGGPISAGSARNFYFYATAFAQSWAGQGGVAGYAGLNCPGTLNPNGGAPSAAVITITVVSPTAPGNWILWGGANPIPTASALNWTGPGDVLANTTVVPAGGRSGSGPGGAIADFAVEYNGPSGSAQFIADVVGYLVENRATALDCYETPVVSATIPGDASGGNGAYGGVDGNACPAGWTLVGGNCDTDISWGNLVNRYYVGTFPGAWWHCGYANYDTAVRNIYASSICCRVPGR